MGVNPNPARITGASWRYIEARLVMDAGDAVYAGSYVNKPGYHGTRAQNLARDKKTGRTNYSVRLPPDLQGPDDKTAAYDFKSLSAASGDYRLMAQRGAHALAAFEARDPRLRGWREWLGQTDSDKAAEGLDFATWTKRVPDPTHEWHDHEAELRAYVDSWDNKACMLSVLSGETLDAYLASGGRLIIRPGDPAQPIVWEDDMLMLARGDDGQHWLCDGMRRRPVADGDVGHIKYLGAVGAIRLWTGTTPGEAPDGIWRGVGDLMGLPVDADSAIDYDELAAAIVAKLPTGQLPPTAAQIADELAGRMRA